jgi:hypothetical protein
MAYPVTRPRPAVLDVVILASFILSVLNVVWVGVLGLLVLMLGAGSWLAGPAIGLVGMTLAAVVLLILLAQSLLSVLLFLAAWKTWSGDPAGRSMHRAWAWIIVVLDLIDLTFTGGMEPGAWVRLVYAVFLLYVLNRDDVRRYFAGSPDAYYAKPAAPDDWR